MIRFVRLAVSAGLVSLALVTAAPVSAATSAVKITLKCYAAPEKTTIKNISTSTVKVTSFGSTYQPYAGEPIRVNKTLAPGESVSFKTGRASGSVYGNYIYNDNGRDGVKVVTSAGTVTKHC